MSGLKQELEDFNFSKKGFIIVKEDKTHPEFELFNPLEAEIGNVYLWVIEVDSIPSKILYIGKAGSTITKRCSQHLGGLKGSSKTGIRNANKLLQLFNEGTKIAIYARHSQKATILGQIDISLCDAEEKALIAFYKNKYKLFNKL